MADSDETTTTARPNGSAAAHAATASTPRSRRASPATAARNTVRRVRARTEPEVESLESEVEQLRADLKSITATLNRMGQTAGNELKSTATAQAEDLKARGQSALDYAQDEFGQFEKQIKDTIRDKPLTAVAGALALGFILAVVTR
jgi:ElaB/YqjD/DUF883 family membrane-anchored ribosome-binding protein